MTNPMIRVSAVIPTRYRPAMVMRAVHSVLTQTMGLLECIVVIDGPDSATEEALGFLCDARLRVIALRENVGGCEARNIGARAARGEWVALLDDDDEWLPCRLGRQLQAVDSAGVTMVASRFLDRSAPGDDLLRPVVFPAAGQHISEFLWCEVSWLGGIAGFPQTSTWLIRRDFFLEVPFTKGLKVLQDLDWLLRAYPHPRMQVRFVADPLSIFHNEQTRQRVTRRVDWQYCREWAMANRHLFTEKALAFFLVIYCINPAAQQGASWGQLESLLRDVWRLGACSAKLVSLCFLYTCIYPYVGRVVSRRGQASALYRMAALLRHRSTAAKAQA